MSWTWSLLSQSSFPRICFSVLFAALGFLVFPGSCCIVHSQFHSCSIVQSCIDTYCASTFFIYILSLAPWPCDNCLLTRSGSRFLTKWFWNFEPNLAQIIFRPSFQTFRFSKPFVCYGQLNLKPPNRKWVHISETEWCIDTRLMVYGIWTRYHFQMSKHLCN